MVMATPMNMNLPKAPSRCRQLHSVRLLITLSSLLLLMIYYFDAAKLHLVAQTAKFLGYSVQLCDE